MQYSHAIREPDVFCYTLAYWMSYDPDSVWELVQRHGGNIAPLAGGYYDYYIDRQYASILVLAFPELRRQYQKDLYT
jgi:hypothetical protein